jgi:TP901-1 family phage major tail protein
MALLGKDAWIGFGDIPDGVDETAEDIDITDDLTEIDNVKDLSTDFSAGEADITTRGSAGWRETVATLRESTVTFGMVWDPGDAAFDAIQEAFLDNSLLAIAVLDSDPTATPDESQGLVGNFSVTNFSLSQNLEEAQMVDVTLKLAEYGYWHPVPAE